MMTGLAELKAGTTNETTVTTLDAEAVWPNQAAPVVPGSVASLSTPIVLQAGGFFVSVPGHPSKADGTVDLLVATSDEATEFSKRTISSYKKDNFYHHAEWLVSDSRRAAAAAAADADTHRHHYRRRQPPLMPPPGYEQRRAP